MIWDDSYGTCQTEAAPQDPLADARWIWLAEGNPAVSAPVGTRYFRRSFNVADKASVESARVFMTADNSYELWINGRLAGKGDNFHVAGMFDIKPLLRSGLNVLAVVAENGGSSPNPAGLAGTLLMNFRDGHALTLPTDKTWQTTQSAQGPWKTETTLPGDWQAAMELGPMGMAPWGAVEMQSAGAEQYCDFSVVTGLLAKLGIPPDFESDVPLRYTHRRASNVDIYFVANREDHTVDATCTFRVAGSAPALWDPLTGGLRDLPEYASRDGLTTVPMRFEPAQSFFVVFRKAGRRATGTNFPQTTQAVELSGSWQVSFDPKWGGPEKTTFQSLDDWTKRPEDGIKYYSGVATYRKAFDLPAAAQGKQPGAREWYLDLGTVKNIARVRLNGQDLGVVWCAPWRVQITGAVKPTGNQLEIEVANLWPNRLIGDQALPPEKRLTSTTWNPFKKDSALLESGLLGPVSLWTGEK